MEFLKNMSRSNGRYPNLSYGFPLNIITHSNVRNPLIPNPFSSDLQAEAVNFQHKHFGYRIKAIPVNLVDMSTLLDTKSQADILSRPRHILRGT